MAGRRLDLIDDQQRGAARRPGAMLQPGVGHYGVFNGSRFRSEIAPRISDFILTHNGRPKRSTISRKVLVEA